MANPGGENRLMSLMSKALQFLVLGMCSVPWLGSSVCSEPAELAGSEPSDFLVRVWGQDDGVPPPSITSFAQGSDGYLWMVSELALARFDGERFVETPSEPFSSAPDEWEGRCRVVGRFLQSQSGTVWFIPGKGGLWRWSSHEFERWPAPSSRTECPAGVWELDGSEHVLILTRSGRLLHGGRTGVRVIADPKLRDPVLPETICRDARGAVWLMTRRKEVLCLELTGRVVQPLSSQRPPVRPLTLAADGCGVVWLGTEEGLSCWRDDHFEPVPAPVPGQAFPVRAIAAARQGPGLWVSSAQKAWVRESRAWKGPVGDWPDSVPWRAQLVDRAGRLWLAPPKEGVWCLRPEGGLTRLGPQDGLSADATLLFCDREDDVWAGLDRTGIARIRDRRFGQFKVSQGSHAVPLWNIAEDADGGMWFSAEAKGPVRRASGLQAAVFTSGTEARAWTKALAIDHAGRVAAAFRDQGVACFDGRQFQPVLPWPKGAESSRVLYQDRAKNWWLGTDTGLYGWAQGCWERWGPDRGLPDYPIRALTEDRDGRLWVGLLGGGVANLETNRFRSFTRQHGLANDSVYTLCPGADGSLWIGTRGGLGRWRGGQFTHLTVAQGLPDNRVVQILEDGLGVLWLGTRNGLCRVRISSLDRLDPREQAVADCVVFDRDDGLPTRVFQDHGSPACWRARDGRLWFLTASAAVYTEPHGIQLSVVQPPVRIEEVLLDGHPCTGNGRPGNPVASDAEAFSALAVRVPASVELSPGRHLLEIRYAAPSLAVPEQVSFEYVMEGLNREWVKAGATRTAVYRLLPPGQYRFRVRAQNHDGIGDPVGAALAILVKPSPWQRIRWPALTVTILVGLGAAVFAWLQRSRMQRQLARLEMQRAREAERLRISRDLHDNLGASLTEIGMLAENGSGGSALSASTTNPCRIIKQKVNEAVSELDALVWAVNPRQDTLASLVGYLASFVEEYAAGSGLECRLELAQEWPACALSSELRHNVFLAVREAVHNAVRHAAPRRLVLRMEHGACSLRIALEDDGRGFDPGAVAQGNGLINLRERLASLGGQCDIHSQTGSGTTVVLSVPLPQPTHDSYRCRRRQPDGS
jgi:signal transduction histidine kinase/ligand-binding sensor domain-containing protein